MPALTASSARLACWCRKRRAMRICEARRSVGVGRRDCWVGAGDDENRALSSADADGADGAGLEPRELSVTSPSVSS